MGARLVVALSAAAAVEYAALLVSTVASTTGTTRGAVGGALTTGTGTPTKVTTTSRTCTAARAKEKNARECAGDLVTKAVSVITEKERATGDGTTSAV